MEVTAILCILNMSQDSLKKHSLNKCIKIIPNFRKDIEKKRINQKKGVDLRVDLKKKEEVGLRMIEKKTKNIKKEGVGQEVMTDVRKIKKGEDIVHQKKSMIKVIFLKIFLANYIKKSQKFLY